MYNVYVFMDIYQEYKSYWVSIKSEVGWTVYKVVILTILLSFVLVR